MSHSLSDCDRRCRVLHIIDTLGMGGAPRVIVELLRNVDKGRFPQLVCGLRRAAWFAHSLAELGVRVEVMDGSALNLPWTTRKVWRIAEQFEPDIVHVHLEASKAVGWFVSKRIRGCAFIIHEHVVPRGNKYPVWMQRPFARRADLILAVSETVARQVQAVYAVPDDRVRVLANGVNIDQVDAEPAANLLQELALSGDSLLVGFAGRLAKSKNLPLLLAAWRTVVVKHPQATLILIGDGPERDALEMTTEKLGVAGSVRFLGRRRDVFGIMKSLDVYVQPTKAEGLPLSALEAMACRLPVVATDVGGTSEAVADGETGSIVPPENVSALADAINSYLDDESKRALAGRAGRRRVEQKFDWRARAETLEDIYLGLCRQHDVAPGQIRFKTRPAGSQ